MTNNEHTASLAALGTSTVRRLEEVEAENTRLKTTLELIVAELDGREWDSDTGTRIAEILDTAGYVIEDST